MEAQIVTPTSRSFVLAAIVVISIALSGCSPSTEPDIDASSTSPTSNAEPAPAESMSIDDDQQEPTQPSDPDTSEPTPETEAEASSEPPKTGSYITFAEFEEAPETYANSRTVLFFNADWCSTCQIARENFEKEAANLPSDLTIVIVDFDTATDMKKKYGVTIQHTFVQVDPEGTELAKWAGSVTVDEVEKNTV